MLNTSYSGSVSGGSSSSVSLEREKISDSISEKDKFGVIKEGPLHCKITDIDGKVRYSGIFSEIA